MYLYFTDETNTTSNKRLEFFMYGGIIAHERTVLKLVKDLHRIKEDHDIPRDVPVRWKNEYKKKEITSEDKFRILKNDVLDVFTKSEAKIVLSLSPHDFYHTVKIKGNHSIPKINPEKECRTYEYALNTCLQKFNEFLGQEDEVGCVFADEFGSKKLKQHLNKHCFDAFHDGTKYSSLKRIIYPVIQLDSDYSQVHQINDVVLGSIQYSLKEIQYNFLPKLKHNFWCSNGKINNHGVNIYPKSPKGGTRTKLEVVKSKFIRNLNN